MTAEQDNLEPQDEPGLTEDAAAAPDEVAQLRRERDELESKFLRTAADLQNFIRRSSQNISDAREQQLMDLSRSLLTVMDHFDHALDLDPSKASAQDLLEGVRIVRDELLSVLERFGVKRLEAKQGEEFNPMRHEAVMRQKVEGMESHRVANQFQPGYIIGEKTLRPAKVSITE